MTDVMDLPHVYDSSSTQLLGTQNPQQPSQSMTKLANGDPKPSATISVND